MHGTALVKDTPDGPVCENVIACCPGEGAQVRLPLITLYIP